MKQFQKVGVAAAVAYRCSRCGCSTDSAVSRTETGDLAIIPYYTVMDGTNTGMHIINTTESTQVVRYAYVAEPIPKTHSTLTWLCRPAMSGQRTLAQAALTAFW